MDEKVLVRGKFKRNMPAIICLVTGVALIIIAIIAMRYIYCNHYNYSLWYKDALYTYKEAYERMLRKDPEYAYLYSFRRFIFYADESERYLTLAYMGVPMLLLALYFKLRMGRCSISVTESKVIGKTSFGRRVDLPIGQISAIGQGGLSSIYIATSAGKIRFWLLSNRIEITNVLTDLIQKYQKIDANKQNNEMYSNNTSPADELLKYKNLLDSGIITQEEFDTKKKQILDL